MHTLAHSRPMRFCLAFAAALLVMAAVATGAFAVPPEGAEQPEQPIAVPTQPASLSGAPVYDKVVRVNEGDYDVDTEIDLMYGDRVTLSASGTIYSGVWLAGRNGPQGWDWLDCDKKFPLPCTHPYSLLRRVGTAGSSAGYAYTGLGADFRHYGPSYSRLWLRINDDRPGNGNGGFDVAVRVYR